MLSRVFLCCALSLLWTAHGDAAVVWQDLEAGLQFASLSAQSENTANFDILRIDPALFRFSLHSVSAGNPASYPLLPWAEREGLTVAINAGMYLPDYRTHTGYMRSGAQVNNPHVHSKFGAFFVAEPDSPELPPSAILDRECDPWQARLPRYALVVQNYRLIDTDGKLLWLPGGPEHSIAAVGQDRQGHILFIHRRLPMAGEAFAAALLRMPLELRSLMYVEGGSQAAMLAHCPKLKRVWLGQSVMTFLSPSENANAPPNMIGVRRRAR